MNGVASQRTPASAMSLFWSSSDASMVLSGTALESKLRIFGMKLANGTAFSFTRRPAFAHMPTSAWQIFSSLT